MPAHIAAVSGAIWMVQQLSHTAAHCGALNYFTLARFEDVDHLDNACALCGGLGNLRIHLFELSP